MNIEKLLKSLHDEAHGKIAKSVPMRKNWKPAWDAWRKATEDAEKAHNKMKNLKSAFWVMVEQDLNDYDHTMGVSDDGREVNIYEE